jgi:hypothetical protein
LDNVDIFYGHLEYFEDIWDILWPFGSFCVYLVHFAPFWYFGPRKIWQPCLPVVASVLNVYQVRSKRAAG